MNQDKIIEMAWEAGFDNASGIYYGELERFAALVAAHEREAVMEIVNTIGGNFAVECAKAIRARGEK